jgi:uncharacterized protein YodC (DUF2158 family)
MTQGGGGKVKRWIPDIGDLVKLRSGGPTMTIAREVPNVDFRTFRCHWFTADGLMHGDDFYQHELKRVAR